MMESLQEFLQVYAENWPDWGPQIYAAVWVTIQLTAASFALAIVLGLLLAWGAAVLAKRRPSPRRTYGFSRATIIASLFSGLLLMGAVGAIGWEAVNRLMDPPEPAGKTIMIVAAIGAKAAVASSARPRNFSIASSLTWLACLREATMLPLPVTTLPAVTAKWSRTS